MLATDPQLQLSVLQSILSVHSEIVDYLDFEGCVRFIELVQLLKTTITLSLPPDEAGPPEHLSRSIHEFLAKSLRLTHEAAKLVWRVLSPLAWGLDMDPNDLHSFGQRHIQSFLDHGIPRGIGEYYVLTSFFFMFSLVMTEGFYHFMPPIRHCLDPGCTMKRKSKAKGNLVCRELAEGLSVPVTVFTQDFGPIPGISTSLYCRGQPFFFCMQVFVNDLLRMSHQILCKLLGQQEGFDKNLLPWTIQNSSHR